MELFLVALVVMAAIGNVNRNEWNVEDDFTSAGAKVWLSDYSRTQAITLPEERLTESHKYTFTGQSLT